MSQRQTILSPPVDYLSTKERGLPIRRRLLCLISTIHFQFSIFNLYLVGQLQLSAIKKGETHFVQKTPSGTHHRGNRIWTNQRARAGRTRQLFFVNKSHHLTESPIPSPFPFPHEETHTKEDLSVSVRSLFSSLYTSVIGVFSIACGGCLVCDLRGVSFFFLDLLWDQKFRRWRRSGSWRSSRICRKILLHLAAPVAFLPYDVVFYMFLSWLCFLDLCAASLPFFFFSFYLFFKVSKISACNQSLQNFHLHFDF